MLIPDSRRVSRAADFGGLRCSVLPYERQLAAARRSFGQTRKDRMDGRTSGVGRAGIEPATLGLKARLLAASAIRIVEGSIYAKPRNSRSRRMTHDLLDPVRPSRKDGAVAGTRALWVYVAVVPGCRSGSGHPRQRDNRCSLRTRDRRGGGSRCRLDAASPANEIASRLTRASSREREAAAMLRGRVRR
jgi:hypothetical protein